MLKYKNISCHPLTFYGVTFNPNEIKEVPGYINHVKMIRVQENNVSISMPKEVISLPREEEPKAEAQPQIFKKNNKRKKS